MTVDIDPAVRARRVQETVATTARRLRPLCGHMSETDFAAMVQAMGERSYAQQEALVAPSWWRART
jgi:hypothetical protein